MDPGALRHDSGHKISERPKVIDYSLARGCSVDDGEVRIGEENKNEGYSDDMHQSP